MPIPPYDALMLPLLRASGDGATRSTSELMATVAEQFRLTQEELDVKLPSGKQGLFANRLHWAGTYLVKAGLLSRPRRAHLQITPEGRAVLASPPREIDRAFLLRYPSFAEFVSPQPEEKPPIAGAPAHPAAAVETPLERIEAAEAELRADLADELLAKLKTGSPAFFERVVVDLLERMGYAGSFAGAAVVLGRAGDGGVDGVIKQDRLGLEAVYVQAKRWDHTVGRPTVQEFAGSLQGKRAKKGVLMTTARFSQDANTYVDAIDLKIVLIDGAQLVQLMIEHEVGVATGEVIKIRRVDPGYFEDE